MPIRVLNFAETESPAMKWLRRYLDEKEPTLKNFAQVVRELEAGGRNSLPPENGTH